MPVIRVSDATMERMKAHARPFEDNTPEDVVRRALDALDATTGREVAKVGLVTVPREERQSRVRTKPTGISKLPQKEFRLPILQCLDQLGGRATVSEIRRVLGDLIAPRLGEDDYSAVSSGDPRWWNAACWERLRMVKEGLLRSDSGYGVWELSDQGRASLKP